MHLMQFRCYFERYEKVSFDFKYEFLICLYKVIIQITTALVMSKIFVVKII